MNFTFILDCICF